MRGLQVSDRTRTITRDEFQPGPRKRRPQVPIEAKHVEARHIGDLTPVPLAVAEKNPTVEQPVTQRFVAGSVLEVVQRNGDGNTGGSSPDSGSTDQASPRAGFSASAFFEGLRNSPANVFGSLRTGGGEFADLLGGGEGRARVQRIVALSPVMNRFLIQNRGPIHEGAQEIYQRLPTGAQQQLWNLGSRSVGTLFGTFTLTYALGRVARRDPRAFAAVTLAGSFSKFFTLYTTATQSGRIVEQARSCAAEAGKAWGKSDDQDPPPTGTA